MPSTYSNLKIQLMATGENNTTWGDVTNLNLGTALEEAIVGSADVPFSSADVTLTLTDTNASQTARNMRLNLTGTATAGYNLIVPAIEKPYIINNATDGTITVKNATGTGIAVPAGKTMWVYNNGTNVVDAVTRLSSLTLGTDLAVADGGTGASTFTSNGVLIGNGTSAITATAAGTTGQVLVGNTGGAPSWATLSGIGVTSFSAGTTGLTPNSATTGAITLAGTLNVANGGTGATGLTSGYLVKGNGTSAVGASVVYDDGTNVGIGTSSPSSFLGKLAVTGNITAASGGKFYQFDSGNSTGRYMQALSNYGLSIGKYDGSDVEQVRITSAGDVGIGTSSPGAKLDVQGSTNDFVAINALNTNNNAGTATSTALKLGFTSTVGTHYATFKISEDSVNDNSGSLTIGLPFGGVESTKLTLTSAGNLGLGVAPKTWTTYQAIDVGASGGYVVNSAAGGFMGVGQNFYYNGSYRYAGSAAASFYYQQTGAHIWQTAASGTAGNAITFTQAMTLDASGNLLVGTTTPTYSTSGRGLLEVNGSSSALIAIKAGDTARGYFAASSSATELSAVGGSQPLLFTTNSAERMRIDSSGQVGIGTTSPVTKLDVRSGYITAGTAASTEGSKILGGYYSSGNIATFGGERSNGGPVIGYGVWPSTVAEASFVSATAINVARGAYTMVGNVHKWFAGGAQTVAVDSAVSMSEVMRLDASGNLGIGTSSPGRKLDVNGTVRIGGAASLGQAFFSSTYAYDVVSVGCGVTTGYGDSLGLAVLNSTGVMTFATNSTERMRIDSSGNVGIGTSSPGAKLHVAGASYFASDMFVYQNGGIFFNGNASYAGAGIYARNTGADLVLAANGGEGARLTATGLGIGTSSPGYKVTAAVTAGSDAFFADGNTQSYSGYRIRAGASGQQWAFRGGNTTMALTDVTAGADRLAIDTSGNLGLGVTPSGTDWATWLYVGAATINPGPSYDRMELSQNYVRVGSADKYIANGYATQYRQISGEHQWRIAGSGSAGGTISFTQAMTLDASGNLGIGTSSPAAKLQLQYATGSTGGIHLKQSGWNYTTRFGAVGTDGGVQYWGLNYNFVAGTVDSSSEYTTYIAQNANSSFISFGTSAAVNTAPSERARIDSSGNLLVGKTAVSATTIGAELRPDGQVCSALSSTSNLVSTLNVYSTGAAAYRFYVDMTGTVFATSTTISAISDIRLKENVRELDAGLDVILALKPRRFDWKEGKGKDVKDDMGFIAQEVEEVLPALVGDWKAGEGEPDDLKSVKAGDLIPVLVKAIQELTARVAQLEGN